MAKNRRVDDPHEKNLTVRLAMYYHGKLTRLKKKFKRSKGSFIREGLDYIFRKYKI